MNKDIIFKPLEPKPDFPKLEREILRFWEKNKILEKYLKKNAKSKNRFKFLDGPITANNPMGVHHAWGRTYKDIWQRYFTMRGCKQRYQNGFDCQGLWVEVEVEKELGFKNKKDIEEYGIDKFVKKCKERVMKYSAIQTEQSKRLGYFMDWENSYYTMSDENNYGIWSFLKKCHEKGYLYKGRDSVPWCPRCGTAISQHEILTEEYKELTHTSVYVKFPIISQGYFKDKNLLIWTTTPWTLPSNVAVAVDAKEEYIEFDIENEKNVLILAKSRVEAVLGKDWKKIGSIIKKFKGAELVGLCYQGAFDDLKAVKDSLVNSKYQHRVIAADNRNIVVSSEEGTGLIHIAPGAGAEDFAIAKQEKLPVIASIDEEGKFLEGFGKYSGKFAGEVSREIVQSDYSLTRKERSDVSAEKFSTSSNNIYKPFIFKTEEYTHRYPTCWRCKEELLFRVVDEWYIAMDKPSKSKIQNLKSKNLREQLKKIAKKIKWIPEFGLKRELDWLDNMRDWLISKKRYWGLALPIWECQCGNFEIIGSKEELKERAVAGWDEFEGNSPHRPWIDKIKIKCSECGKSASRILDVGNPWLDAGIVPFSTAGYFSDKNYWRDWFPADFITESFPGQFKNWFYALLVMSAVMENTNPFETVLGFASVKDEKGEEMHKSKGNAIWFDEAAEKTGVDGMRWLYAAANPELNLNFGYRSVELVQRRFLMILWNVTNFFITYSNADKWQAPVNVKRQTKSNKFLDKWIIARLNQLIKNVTENMGHYNARISAKKIEYFVVYDLSTWYLRRSRKRRDQEFYNNLYYILVTVVKLISPFTPFMAEKLFQHLSMEDKSKSAHLEDWPEYDKSLIDKKIMKQVEDIRKIVELGHSLRAAKNIKVRQPLARAWVYIGGEWNDEIKKILEEELNIENIESAPLNLDNIKKSEKNILRAKEKGLAIAIDTEITSQLFEKGQVRDLIRQIQSARKKAGFTPGEQAIINISAPENIISLIKNNREYLKGETLSNAINLKSGNKLSISIGK